MRLLPQPLNAAPWRWAPRWRPARNRTASRCRSCAAGVVPNGLLTASCRKPEPISLRLPPHLPNRLSPPAAGCPPTMRPLRHGRWAVLSLWRIWPPWIVGHRLALLPPPLAGHPRQRFFESAPSRCSGASAPRRPFARRGDPLGALRFLTMTKTRTSAIRWPTSRSLRQTAPAPSRPGDRRRRARQPAAGLGRCCGPGNCGGISRFQAPTPAWFVAGRTAWHRRPSRPVAGDRIVSTRRRQPAGEARRRWSAWSAISSRPQPDPDLWPKRTASDSRSDLTPADNDGIGPRIGAHAGKAQWAAAFRPATGPLGVINQTNRDASPSSPGAPSRASSLSPAFSDETLRRCRRRFKIVEMGAHAGQAAGSSLYLFQA